MQAIMLGVVIGLMATAASAKDLDSANCIVPGCKATGVSFTAARCAGIIEGIAFMAENSDVACLDIPDGVTHGQMNRVVVSYIEARPSRMHEGFKSLALEALLNAWPCRR